MRVKKQKHMVVYDFDEGPDESANLFLKGGGEHDWR